MSQWVSLLQNAQKSCMVQGNLKKVHYDLADGRELVEEYNTDTGVLTRRAWKVKSDIGGDGQWDIEIGDPEPTRLRDDNYIKEDSTQPIVSKRITKTMLEWRIRNLPYPINVYSVTADQENQCLVVRTSNKKYFKKLEMLDLKRANLLPEQDRISFSHKFNTLIITYKKPKELLDMENAIYQEVKKLQPKDEGDMGCKPS